AVDFVVNTHWHFDHAEGNLTLGPEGAWIVAHEESQKRMGLDQVINLVTLKYGQPAYPKQAQPVISYADRMQFHFNGQDIELRYFGPAHTTGDTAVFFKQANAVHLGDVFNAAYPFIDVDNGGDLDGVIRFCEAVLAETDENTKVIPGHGAVQNRAALVAYIDMLRAVRGKIAGQVVAGASVEDVIASQPTAEFDATYGDPTRLVDRAYASLKRTHQRKLEADAAAAAEVEAAAAAEPAEAKQPGAPSL
ncbi:MAG: MBL fold metallo-hydrolase, partial [Pseudomonadales bacterium]